MALLDDWRKVAYNENTNKGELQKFWQDYFLQEKEIYAEILKTPDTVVREQSRNLPRNSALIFPS